MPVLLPNVYLATTRTSYAPNTQQTAGASPSLPRIAAHIRTTTAKHLMVLPESVSADFTAIVESGTAIAIGDVVTSITLLDGLTPWPNDVAPAGSANAPNITWRVVYTRECSPSLLPYREVYLKRIFGSGPTHP